VGLNDLLRDGQPETGAVRFSTLTGRIALVETFKNVRQHFRCYAVALIGHRNINKSVSLLRVQRDLTPRR